MFLLLCLIDYKYYQFEGKAFRSGQGCTVSKESFVWASEVIGLAPVLSLLFNLCIFSTSLSLCLCLSLPLISSPQTVLIVHGSGWFVIILAQNMAGNGLVYSPLHWKVQVSLGSGLALEWGNGELPWVQNLKWHPQTQESRYVLF